ncbi:MAG: TRAP transporter small permease [Kiritimatiellae bacterium]|nr:TRAP transporter small permease [Kiritimatiellia bacterium]
MDTWRVVRHGFLRSLEILLMLMVAVLTLTVLWGVFTRFVLGHQAEYTDELARVLLIWISMIGGALAFGEKAHLGVDYFVIKMDPEARKTLAIIVQVIILLLAVIVFMIGGWTLAMGQMAQKLPTMPWMTRGMVYLSIPLAGVFILLFAVESMITLIQTPADKIGALTKSEG